LNYFRNRKNISKKIYNFYFCKFNLTLNFKNKWILKEADKKFEFSMVDFTWKYIFFLKESLYKVFIKKGDFTPGSKKNLPYGNFFLLGDLNGPFFNWVILQNLIRIKLCNLTNFNVLNSNLKTKFLQFL